MSLYKITDLYISADEVPKSFEPFLTNETVESDVIVVKRTTNLLEPDKTAKCTKTANFYVYQQKNGDWLFTSTHAEIHMLVSHDYLNAVINYDEMNTIEVTLLLRILIECRMILRGNLSLHSSCIHKDGFALNFSGVSGVGKSTRAMKWIEALGFEFISGDRPAMMPGKSLACGAPWDGKEDIHKNISLPVKMIFDVRRAPFVRIRKLTEQQAYSFLIKQIFVPMWDSEATMYAFMNLRRLIRNVPVCRLFCNNDENSAVQAYDIVYNKSDKILTEDKDMRIKDEFIVRNMLGEYMAIPTGDNIAKFDGSVILNDVSAFIIDQLKKPTSKEDLLELILGEYEVSREQASADLDALLLKLDEYGMLEK